MIHERFDKTKMGNPKIQMYPSGDGSPDGYIQIMHPVHRVAAPRWKSDPFAGEQQLHVRNALDIRSSCAKTASIGLRGSVRFPV